MTIDGIIATFWSRPCTWLSTSAGFNTATRAEGPISFRSGAIPAVGDPRHATPRPAASVSVRAEERRAAVLRLSRPCRGHVATQAGPAAAAQRGLGELGCLRRGAPPGRGPQGRRRGRGGGDGGASRPGAIPERGRGGCAAQPDPGATCGCWEGAGSESGWGTCPSAQPG